MPLAFTSEPATVGEASRPLAAPFWAGSAPRTPTKSDADADADADYISRGAGRSPSSLSPIPEEPQERRRLSPTYEAGTPPPEGMGPDARKALDNAIREGASIAVPSPEPDAEDHRGGAATAHAHVRRGRRSGKARGTAAAVSPKRRARLRRLAHGAAGAAAPCADAGASSPVLWKAAVFPGGGARVRSVRRRAGAAASTVASTKKGVPLGAGRRRRRGRDSARAARGPRGEGPGVAGAGRRDRGVSGLKRVLLSSCVAPSERLRLRLRQMLVSYSPLAPSSTHRAAAVLLYEPAATQRVPT